MLLISFFYATHQGTLIVTPSNDIFLPFMFRNLNSLRNTTMDMSLSHTHNCLFFISLYLIGVERTDPPNNSLPHYSSGANRCYFDNHVTSLNLVIEEINIIFFVSLTNAGALKSLKIPYSSLVYLF